MAINHNIPLLSHCCPIVIPLLPLLSHYITTTINQPTWEFGTGHQEITTSASLETLIRWCMATKTWRQGFLRWNWLHVQPQCWAWHPMNSENPEDSSTVLSEEVFWIWFRGQVPLSKYLDLLGSIGQVKNSKCSPKIPNIDIWIQKWGLETLCSFVRGSRKTCPRRVNYLQSLQWCSDHHVKMLIHALNWESHKNIPQLYWLQPFFCFFWASSHSMSFQSALSFPASDKGSFKLLSDSWRSSATHQLGDFKIKRSLRNFPSRKILEVASGYD